MALIVDERDRFLMLSHPDRAGSWEVIAGALEHGESLIDAVLREVREEAGAALRVEPLGGVHAYTVPFDEVVTHLTSSCFLLRFVGGAVVPGDDMAGSGVEWMTAAELSTGGVVAPGNVPWIFERALELDRLWVGDPPELQPPF